MTTSVGQPDVIAIGGFLIFIALSLGITWWAARKTRTSSEFFAAGGKISAAQNGFALKSVLTGVVHAPRFTGRTGDQTP